jgi:hypothetical protein
MSQAINPSILFVLGAPDVEMSYVEKFLLNRCPNNVAFAMDNSFVRVISSNAYKMHSFSYANPEMKGSSPLKVYLVECDFEKRPNGWTFIKLDHHQPGDFGYDIPAKLFPYGSSYGQVMMKYFELEFGMPYVWIRRGNNWVLKNTLGHTISDVPTSEDLMVMAADHCLADAYKGLCPGVNPDDLFYFRIQSKAEFQSRSISDVMFDVMIAIKALQSAPKVTLGGIKVANLLDKSVPELPEASAYLGIPFMSVVKDKNGKNKVVLQSAPFEAVAEFLKLNNIPEVGNLTGHYGSPTRGYAGAYIE